LEKYLADFIQAKRASISVEIIQKKIMFSQRMKEITKEAWSITKKVTPYVLL